MENDGLRVEGIYAGNPAQGADWTPIPRATSAPPNLELSAKSLFAFRADHPSVFPPDIRCDELYDQFYQHYKGPNKLPAPIQTLPFVEAKPTSNHGHSKQNPNMPWHNSARGDNMSAAVPALKGYGASHGANGSQFLQAVPEEFPQNAVSELDSQHALQETTSSSKRPSSWHPLPTQFQSLSLKDGRVDIPSATASRVPDFSQLEAMVSGNSLLSAAEGFVLGGSDMEDRNELSVSEMLPDCLLKSDDNFRQHSQSQNMRGQGHDWPGDGHLPSAFTANGLLLGRSAQGPGRGFIRNQHEVPSSQIAVAGHPDSLQMMRLQMMHPRQNDSVLSSRGHADANLGALASQTFSGTQFHEYDGPNSLCTTESTGMSMADDDLSRDGVRFFKNGYSGRAEVFSRPDRGGLSSSNRKPAVIKTDRPIARKPMESHDEIIPDSLSFPHALSTSRCSDTSSPPSSVGDLYSYEQIVGKVCLLAKDQHGCRYLQKKLEERSQLWVDQIYDEARHQIVELMTDPFGNYLCQKLVEYCNDEQRLRLSEAASSHLVSISLNMHGTRAVQKMIEHLNLPAQVSVVVRSLRPGVVALVKDLNGNHVVQQCLRKLTSAQNQFIYDAVKGHCVDIATHRHGCCVLQRCIDYANQAQKHQLVSEIVANAQTLVQDPFGNYVVQYVLDLNIPAFSRSLMTRLMGMYADLATQKFSSNVVEKCLQLADADVRASLIAELSSPDRISRLLQDPYANYVIQRALTVAQPPQLNHLVDSIRPHLALLRNTPYGKRIQSKILKKFPSLGVSDRSASLHY